NATAIADMATATAEYASGQGLVPSGGTDYSSADLSTFSPLGPGIYKATSSAGLTGNLTLNGPGTYVFQIGSTLTTAAGSTITLAGGATSSNVTVLWCVGSSAT